MMMNNIGEVLDLVIPEPRCELNYSKDYELLLAVMLSAQTTDKSVNEVTKILFDKYKDLKELSLADICDVENKILEQRLDNYEKEERFRLEFVKPDYALEINRNEKHSRLIDTKLDFDNELIIQRAPSVPILLPK